MNEIKSRMSVSHQRLFTKEISLSGGGKQKHGQNRGTDNCDQQKMPPTLNPNHQKFGIENKKERKNCRANIIEETLYSGFNRITLRNR